MKTPTNTQIERINELLEDMCPGTRYNPSESANAKDITGQQFGGFTAIVPVRKGKWGRLRWLCQCECGEYRLRTVSELGNYRKRDWGCGCGIRLPEGEAAFNNLVRSYRQRADRKGLEYDLTKEEFRKLTKLPCHYCGTPPNQSKSPGGYETTGFYTYSGLDRINSAKGYTADNVVPCCVTCNHAKMDMTYTEFIAWLNQVALYRRNQRQ